MLKMHQLATILKGTNYAKMHQLAVILKGTNYLMGSRTCCL